MTPGSQQLRLFRRALHLDGKPLEEAAAIVGISLGEASLWAADDATNLPPPEAFELLATLYTTEEKETSVAHKSKDSDTAEDNGGVYKRPNASEAIRIYRSEIAPRKAFISEKQGDLSDPYARIKDECHFPRKILDMLMFLEGLEDAKRDHFMTALHLGLTEMNFTRPLDLVAMAEGMEPDAPIVPSAGKGRSRMATIPSDGIDADLATAAGVEPSSLQFN